MRHLKTNSFFEDLCQHITSLISSHTGSVAALIILISTSAILIWDSQSHLADVLEKFLTMLSLVLLFFLQRSQTKDTLSLQIKLNELLKAVDRADSSLINIEHRSEEELKTLHDDFDQHTGQSTEKDIPATNG